MKGNLAGIFYLGSRHLARQRGRVVLLIGTLALSLFLPMAITVGVDAVERHLRARSAATPLLVGAPGSQLELVFNALYFNKPSVPVLPFRVSREIARETGAQVIPIHAKFQARGFRVVGTSLDYFRFRKLGLVEGNLMGRLGDCVLGSSVAQRLGLKAGDRIVSTPEQMFDIAGVYPLRMRIVGVLGPSGTADDQAVFCDVKTAWVIEGIAHGHQEAKRQPAAAVLEADGTHIALDSSIYEFQEVTPENIGSFHFHGDPGDFPLTAAIVIAPDPKTETILMGRYQPGRAKAWMLRPGVAMEELFATVFRVRDFVVAALGVIGGCAILIMGLVFALSNRLRSDEFGYLANLGAPSATIRGLVLFEAAFVTAIGAVLATGATLLLLGALPRLLVHFAV
ncbi:MAG: putative ABC transport system permease protein [Verrucomicrobia bacterium]|jgi:putative ABC transport system permease protein|nr:MAG: putative ABC transport system permease protein [Verrucomicrobiota bacterium]